MNILGITKITYQQLETWVKSVKTANPLLLKNLPIMWKVSTERGILPEVFVAQTCCETGYFNFGGVLNASFHNTCGLKITKGGGDYVANAHMRFSSWEEGLIAHADHLALYAGAKGFPKYSPDTKGYENSNCKSNGTTKDPRHFTYLYGKSKTVEGLSGTWATNKTYAQTLLSIINRIYATKVEGRPKYSNGTYTINAKITASSLNVRKGRPGCNDYNVILGTLKRGQVVTVKYCLNNWFGIIYNGKQAFICGEYVELL